VQAPAGADAGPSSPYGAVCTPGLAPDATTTLTPPPATLLDAPPTTATIGTTFNYAALTNGVYLVAFVPAGNTVATGDSLYVVTAVNQVKVPDLSLLGFDLPSGATYAVEVLGFAPFATLDAAVTPTGFSTMATDLRLDQGPLVAGQLTSSGVATFSIQ
jgi:hypothetical protein